MKSILNKKGNFSFLLITIFFVLFSTPRSFAVSDNFDAAALYENVLPSLCAIMTLDDHGKEISFGSGFVLSKDGQIVTNAHVISGGEKVNVECGQKKGSVEKIIRYRAGIDLVVLQTNISGLHPLQVLQERNIKPGSVVFALGNPYGLQGTITTGLVSGLRKFDGVEYVQLSADINPGNSGGPIVLPSGDVVAVATMGISGSQGLNFALPISHIDKLSIVSLKLTSLPKTKTPLTNIQEISKSSLEFRGLPLGSSCEKIDQRGGFYPVSEFYERAVYESHLGDSGNGAYNPNGKNIVIHQLLNENVWGIYNCRDGILFSAMYSGIPGNIQDRVYRALVGKYGDPSTTTRGEWGNYIGSAVWNFKDGKIVKYQNAPCSVEYLDNKLKLLLEKKETLKLIDSGEL